MPLFKRHPARSHTEASSPAQAATEQLDEELRILQSVLDHYPPGHQLSLGLPSRCPRCGSFGFVEGVNRLKGTCFNHCLSCRTDWVITERALRAYASGARAPRAATEPLVIEPNPRVDEPGPDDWDERQRRAGRFVPLEGDLAIEVTPAIADRVANSTEVTNSAGDLASATDHGDRDRRGPTGSPPVRRRTLFA